MRKPAAVIIGNHTQGLGIVRSASAYGGEVWVVHDKSLSLSRFSRYLSGYRRIRRGTLNCLADPESADVLLQALLEVPVEYPSILLGVNEDISSFIHMHREALEHKYFLPPVRLDRIYDKFAFNSSLPSDVQIETYLCSEFDIGKISDPSQFILKGRQGGRFRELTGDKAKRLDKLSGDEIRVLLAQLSSDQVLIQRIVRTDRPVRSICSFSIDGTPVAFFAYEKLRQHPNEFGTGTYLRSVRIECLAVPAQEILSKFGFTGISEIEFIFDCDADAYKVVEMNPRTWKSIHFSSQCGQNLVEKYLTYASGGRVSSDDGYTPDKYWADLATDVPQMLREKRFARYHGKFFECTWDRRDPWPAVFLWACFPLMGFETVAAAIVRLYRAKRSAARYRQSPAQ